MRELCVKICVMNRSIQILIIWAVLAVIGSLTARCEALLVLNGVNSKDQRRDYFRAVLELAMDQTVTSHGGYRIERHSIRIPRRRLLAYLEKGIGPVNLAIAGSSQKREMALRAIRVPLAKGLIGNRIFIVRRETLGRLAAVERPEDLLTFTICQGLGWEDTEILQSAGFDVLVNVDYENLFELVNLGRCDLFPRAVYEPFIELRDRAVSFPDLTVDGSWLLHYPLANYFYLGKSNEGLAKRIEAGMEAILADGGIDRLLRSHPATSDVFSERVLEGRRVYHIANPNLHPDTPLKDQRLWISDMSSY